MPQTSLAECALSVALYPKVFRAWGLQLLWHSLSWVVLGAPRPAPLAVPRYSAARFSGEWRKKVLHPSFCMIFQWHGPKTLLSHPTKIQQNGLFHFSYGPAALDKTQIWVVSMFSQGMLGINCILWTRLPSRVHPGPQVSFVPECAVPQEALLSFMQLSDVLRHVTLQFVYKQEPRFPLIIASKCSVVWWKILLIVL